MSDKLLNIKPKAVLKYALLPGIFPRAREFATSGFGYLAFLFATVYRGVRILPANHPFVDPDNIGKFSLIDTIAAAANNIQVNRRNIDQMIVFVALLVALALMFLQFVLVILGLFTGDAFAATGGKPFDSMFVTQYPTNDVAFLMLDYVFGIPDLGAVGAGPHTGFFGSGAGAGGITAFQSGMHALFKFYNMAILLVAVLIFLYFVVVVVVETAQTGVPFGRRFAKIYAPFRLIFAIGLLVPLNYGFNAAQYITLMAAKFGSSFATNGWILYNRALNDGGSSSGGAGGLGGQSNNPLGVENASLIALPMVPSVRQMMEFSSIYHACRDIYGQWVPKNYVEVSNKIVIKPYVIMDGNAKEFLSITYADAKKYFGTGDMEVILGEYDAEENKGYAGSVRPYCGKINISLSNNNPKVFKNSADVSTEGGSGYSTDLTDNGIPAIEKMYFTLVQDMLKTDPEGDRKVFVALGERMSRAVVPQPLKDRCWRNSDLGDADTCQNSFKPKMSIYEKPWQVIDSNQKLLVKNNYEKFRKNIDIKVTEDLERRGWGGAGIWYNNIADLNGAFTGAIYAAPSVKRFPELMEYVKKERQIQDKATSGCNMFSPNLADNKAVTFQGPNDREPVIAMNDVYEVFNCDRANTSPGGTTAGEGGAADQKSPTKAVSSTVIVQVIQQVFGINGLFQLRETSKLNDATGTPLIHPLAQLSTIGKSLVENAIRSMAPAMGSAFMGGMLSTLGYSVGPALTTLSGMFVSIATIGLTAGFVLYYILPFLPFIYFFFAVGAWVKSIFEAMVGVPLWALAHLHIDGDGFSGRAAAPGYFLILEIFLRPIITLFGLIGGIAIFGTATTVLNSVFDVVIVNVTGAGAGDSAATLNTGTIESFRRGVVDQFFYTIMYAILVYMIATASFKMIDTIPKGIMRWIGSGAAKFNDGSGDPAGNLTSYAALGAKQVSEKVLPGIQGGAATAGSATGGLINALSQGPGGGSRGQ